MSFVFHNDFGCHSTRKFFIVAILGSVDDQVATEQPFLWMSMNGEDWNGATREYERKVRTRIIEYIIIAKKNCIPGFISWSHGPKNIRFAFFSFEDWTRKQGMVSLASTKPYEALMISIQAVRILYYYFCQCFLI